MKTFVLALVVSFALPSVAHASGFLARLKLFHKLFDRYPKSGCKAYRMHREIKAMKLVPSEERVWLDMVYGTMSSMADHKGGQFFDGRDQQHLFARPWDADLDAVSADRSSSISVRDRNTTRLRLIGEFPAHTPGLRKSQYREAVPIKPTEEMAKYVERLTLVKTMASYRRHYGSLSELVAQHRDKSEDRVRVRGWLNDTEQGWIVGGLAEGLTFAEAVHKAELRDDRPLPDVRLVDALERVNQWMNDREGNPHFDAIWRLNKNTKANFGHTASGKTLALTTDGANARLLGLRKQPDDVYFAHIDAKDALELTPKLLDGLQDRIVAEAQRLEQRAQQSN